LQEIVNSSGICQTDKRISSSLQVKHRAQWQWP